MRKILFRAKREDDGKWVFGDLTNVKRIVESGVAPQVRVANYNVNKDTVGQFTGLLDSNRVMVFESDIVLFTKSSEVRYYVVRYSEDSLQFQFLSGYEDIPTELHKNWQAYCSITVRGNIYDDPELYFLAMNNKPQNA